MKSREGQGGGQSKRPRRTRAGRGFCVCSCCCCLWFAALPNGRRACSCVPPSLPFGVMLSSQQGFRSSLSFTVLACSSSGSGRGFRSREALEIWLHLVFFKSGSCGSGKGFTQICLRLAYKLWLRQSFDVNLVAPRVLPGGRHLCGRQRLYANPLYLVFCRQDVLPRA